MITSNDSTPMAGYETIEWLGKPYIERRAYDELEAKHIRIVASWKGEEGGWLEEEKRLKCEVERFHRLLKDAEYDVKQLTASIMENEKIIEEAKRRYPDALRDELLLQAYQFIYPLTRGAGVDALWLDAACDWCESAKKRSFALAGESAPSAPKRYVCKECGMRFDKKPIVHYSIDVDGKPLDWCNGPVVEEQAP
jgi:hypothetical protein